MVAIRKKRIFPSLFNIRIKIVIIFNLFAKKTNLLH